MALSQTSSSQMICDLTVQRRGHLGTKNAMERAEGSTIELRIRTSRPDEGRGRCKGSRAWDPRKDFSQCMQQPRTPSTSSAISPQQERTEPSGHRPSIHGTKSSLRREPNRPGDLLRALFGNVTEPFGAFRMPRRDSYRKFALEQMLDGGAAEKASPAEYGHLPSCHRSVPSPMSCRSAASPQS